ncbi:hypothetical protein GCM10007304_31960 [Rhodococcoides trifolii]|uniref:Uncharacterized protein n=1 Tax=Rhodococcoides trifolii TaxID=908250 RepID=A0A917FZW1_9NOCA|nr:hypothetical protein [Rhodococcus trifolii]GGG15495.1 hypothetical protein GCM10007304_31960 [Rhodococcus trifolii]
MSPEKIGSIIGGAFGLVFVLVNTGSLPGAVAMALGLLAVLAFVAVVVAVWRVPRARPSGPVRGGFGKGYWIVVAIEVVAIFGGLRLISGPLNVPDAAVAWIAFVVGVHFFALAAVWKLSFFRVLAIGLTVCGVAGLAAAFAGGPVALIDVIGAVIPGALLLGFALWGSTRALQAR